MGYDWHWGVFLEAASAHERYLDWLITGFATTVKIGALGWLLAFGLGSVLGVMRTLPSRGARTLATAYVDVVRNVPLIVQLFLWYFFMPKLLPAALREWMFAQPPALTAFVTATLGLGVFTAARVCEQVRAGIQAVPPGQRHAALAMGLTLTQTYRHVLLPIAYRMLVPPLTSEMLSIFKNSSVAATVGVIELFSRARQLNDYTARSYESFIAVIVCYLLINSVVVCAMTLVERRLRLPNSTGTAGTT